jgi:hypothetical protein
MRCAECGAEADEKARGWRAALGEEWETDGSLFVVRYREPCYQHEFGVDESEQDLHDD